MSGRPLTVRLEDRLLLRAALLSAGEARAAWDEWRRRVDFDAVQPVALPLLPLVLHNLGPDDDADPIRARVRGVWRFAWVRNGLLHDDLTRVIRLFQGASLPVLVLGGAALGATWYRRGELRAMSALDVLVPADRAKEAMAILQDRDARVPIGRRGPTKAPDRVIPVRAAHTFRSASGRDLDLHWHALSPKCDALDTAIWEASKPLTLHEVTTRSLCSTDELLRVCVDEAYGGASTSLIWAADATALLRSAAHEIDWDRLMRLAGECRLRLAVHDALTWLVTNVDAPVPTRVMRSLARGPVSALERLEHVARVGPTTRWGRAIEHLGRYSRSSRGQPLSARLLGLGDYVIRATEAEGPRDAAGRVWASLRRRR
jgi:Uncharacterised nucleotidyltransferase